MLFLGDFCLLSNDSPSLSAEAEVLFNQADAICLNFEAPILNRPMQSAAKVGPALSQTVKSARLCEEFGITHCALANNHIMDYGDEGLRESILQLNGMVTMGAGFSFEKIYQPAWLEHEKKRIALFSSACQDWQ